jgi:gliding motility-associated-like protein
VNPNVTPTFTISPALCSGGIAPILPTTSLNNVTGTWSPSIVNNITSQQYLFTPASTATCATNFTINITVQNSFDFTIDGSCVGKNFELQIKPSSNLNLNTATINWLNAATNTGISSSNFNATQYLSTQATTTLPISITAVITDNAGCIRSHFYSITDLYCDIQKGISPNGDKLNDFFDLINLNVKKLIIYNRNGMEVFSKEQYTNEWIGQTNSGSELPDGTYYYVIDFNNQSETKTGWIYINREY